MFTVPEEGGRILLRKFGNHLLDHTVIKGCMEDRKLFIEAVLNTAVDGVEERNISALSGK
jgi:hypothetical protein